LLIYPDFSQPFIVACDAPTKAIGAVLSQVRNGEERPVAYCSRQLNSAESKYSVTELELLAFLFATKQFWCYLYGRKFTVHTDHRALKWLLNLQDPSSRLTRWAVKLSEYDFVVEHRPGTKMRHADALSRSVNQVERDLVLSREIIKDEQQKDEACREYRHCENFWNDEEGVLYYQTNKGPPRIVTPSALILTVLKCYHELPFTAHQGVKRTIDFIDKKYWWETMRKDVTDFIKMCDACLRRKTGHKVKAPLGDDLKATEFLDIVSLDIVGTLPVAEQGNKYLLTFIDHYTRFCDAIPIARQDTETIAKEFVTRIITQFGVPKRLLTDQGANFTSGLIKATCKLLHIQKLQTSSYHTQANGICKRMHKLLIDTLSHFVRKDAKNWDKYVPYAVMAYGAMPHCSKYSPYYLVFGREMRLPIEDDWKPHLNKEVVENDYENHVRVLAERLREANMAAGQQSKKSHETAKRYYDQNARLEQFHRGDFVYVHDPTHRRGKAKKFTYQYKGPFEIEQKISSLIYKVR
jgi:transposase InsO family protein